MNNIHHPSFYVIIMGITLCFLYLLVNVYYLIRAIKRLERNIRIDRKELSENFKKRLVESVSKDGDEILVTLLRREIETLKDKQDKRVIVKTLNRKNFDNQKRFASKIFSESGLMESFSI